MDCYSASPIPDPIECPICKNTYNWDYDFEDGEWVLARDYWIIPGQYDFLCGKRCWRKALKEGYYDGNKGSA